MPEPWLPVLEDLHTYHHRHRRHRDDCAYTIVTQELELALEEERRAAEELRSQLTVLERKRIALQTELEDVRGLLEAVGSLTYLLTVARLSSVHCRRHTLSSLTSTFYSVLSCGFVSHSAQNSIQKCLDTGFLR